MKKVRRILIALPPPPSDSPYYELARTWKVELHFANLVDIQPMSLAEFREQDISPLDFNAFIFSGKQAVDNFFRLMREMRLDIPADSRFLCTGEALAQHLYQYIPGAMRRRTYAQARSLNDLIPYMRKHAQNKYLYVGGGIVPPSFLEEATRYHLSVRVLRVYHLRYIPLPLELKRKRFFALCFPTVSSILAWKTLYPTYVQRDTAILVYGHDTRRIAEEEGFRVTDYAPKSGIDSLFALLGHFLKTYHESRRSSLTE